MLRFDFDIFRLSTLVLTKENNLMKYQDALHLQMHHWCWDAPNRSPDILRISKTWSTSDYLWCFVYMSLFTVMCGVFTPLRGKHRPNQWTEDEEKSILWQISNGHQKLFFQFCSLYVFKCLQCALQSMCCCLGWSMFEQPSIIQFTVVSFSNVVP